MPNLTPYDRAFLRDAKITPESMPDVPEHNYADVEISARCDGDTCTISREHMEMLANANRALHADLVRARARAEDRDYWRRAAWIAVGVLFLAAVGRLWG
jgi:hypothetical protein